jgi:microcystin-dependent protein
MSTPFIGEIKITGYNFAPEGWALCDGQTLSISQNTALFSLLGTTFGGNGTTTFNLPNLQCLVPIGAGQGAGLSEYVLGEEGGEASVTLDTSELPAHNHAVSAVSATGTSAAAAGDLLAEPNYGAVYAPSGTSVAMAPQAIAANGSAAAEHNNEQPYLVLNFIIALQGIFPPRS